MIYAPVIIPTLCRAEKLKNCIESLQKNEYAKYTELYISLDYPLEEKHKSGYQEIKTYLAEGIKGFAGVIVIEQTSNQGWHGNYERLREKVFEKYDCYIYTEDDNVFSSNFLEYMDKCLTNYQEDEDVLAVSGYVYPIDWETKQYNSLMIQSYSAAWGFGTWREKEEKMYQMLTVKYLEKQLYSINAMRKLYKASKNQYCNFVKGMIEYTDMLLDNDKVLWVDLSSALYQIFEDKYMIFPTESKVRNMGYGEGGVHCSEIIMTAKQKIDHRHYPYDRQPIDTSLNCEEIKISSKEMKQYWNSIMEKFFLVSQREIVGSIFMQIVCKILGRKFVVRICKKLQRG